MYSGKIYHWASPTYDSCIKNVKIVIILNYIYMTLYEISINVFDTYSLIFEKST